MEIKTVLAHDLIANILSRLPVELVIRCKSVCKAWHALVEDPYFAEIHTGRQCAHPCDPFNISFLLLRIGDHCESQNIKLCTEDLIYNDVRKSFGPNSLIMPVNLTPIFDDSLRRVIVRVIGTCNGLVCLSRWGFDVKLKLIDDTIVCNPVTREYINVPHYNTGPILKTRHGFGYYPSKKEHKILRIASPMPASGANPVGATVRVYTLGSGTWRIKELGQIQHDSVSDAGVHFDGSLYWLCYNTERVHYISYFDLGDEELRMMPTPQGFHLDDYNYCYRLALLERNLCVIETMRDHDGMNIWVMKRDEKNNGYSWSKDFIIPDNPLNDSPKSLHPANHPKLFIRDGRMICLICMDDTRSIFYFDTKTAKSSLTCLPNPVGTDGEKRKRMSWIAVSYMRSIVSLKALGEKDVKMVVEAAGSASRSSKAMSYFDRILWSFRLLVDTVLRFKSHILSVFH